MAKKWDYSDAQSSSAGTMICTACGKKITGGRYRYRQKSKGYDWGYVAQHEACTTEDPKWAEMDAAQDRARIRYEAFMRACVEFRERWGVDDLDHYIQEPRHD